jgi:hypothetical protein
MKVHAIFCEALTRMTGSSGGTHCVSLVHQTRSGIACASIGGQQVTSIGVGGVRSEARRAKRCERTIFVRLPFELSQLARKTLNKLEVLV